MDRMPSVLFSHCVFNMAVLVCVRHSWRNFLGSPA
jgi:hypothetical protein